MSQTAFAQAGSRQPKNSQAVAEITVGKNEFFDGRVVTKPTANRWHNIITTNFVTAIGSRVHRSTCEIYANDMLVRIGKESVCFPDVIVVSGEPTFADESSILLENPTIIIEVCSPTAKAGTRAKKLEGYLAVPDIKECLLVNENEMRIEHYTRQNAKQWIYRIYNEREDVIRLDCIDCKLSLTEVYAQVKLKPSEFSSKAVN
ncbi:MAG: Uma2 family endonuclease [Pyrinomonadaceae bacterium]